MTAAAERKKGDPTFRLLLVKMDDQKPTPERCNQFLLESWRANDQVRSVIRLPAALIERKINAWIAGALFLWHDLSSVFFNESASLVEYDRNWVLHFLWLIKDLLQAVSTVGCQAEYQDKLRKVLELFLLEKIVAIQSGCILIESRIFEHIHLSRVHTLLRVKMHSLRDRYDFKLLVNIETFIRLAMVNKLNGKIARSQLIAFI